MFAFLWFRCIGVIGLCWVCWDLLLLVTFSVCCLGDLVWVMWLGLVLCLGLSGLDCLLVCCLLLVLVLLLALVLDLFRFCG